MGKFGPRLNGKKKAKRWPKGQSSSSNPETKKFRNQAQSYFFQHSLDSTNLTKEIIKKYDAIQGSQEKCSTTEINGTEGSISEITCKTYNTFASDWSNCSNISFNRFFNHFELNSTMHKEMLAILAAVVDIIKQNKGTESSTEYYAALMAMLKSADKTESITAILSLLNMGMKTVPKNVLRIQFSQASYIFSRLLIKYAAEDNYAIIRNCIGCLVKLLIIQESAIWMNSSIIQIVDTILTFTIHSKPKVRKDAQNAICSILKSNEILGEKNPLLFHPVATQVAKYCIAQIGMTSQPGQITCTLHILTLLKNVVHQFPKSSMKYLCEELLGIMTLNNVLVTSCCLQTFHGLFISKPSELILPSQLNSQIINALYDYQPDIEDTQPTLAWLTVMQEAYCNLIIHSTELCTINIPKLIERCKDLWLSTKVDILAGTSHTIKILLEICITPLCKNEKLSQKYKSTLIKIIQIIKEGMKFQYHSALRHVIHVQGFLFKIIGTICQKELAEVLISLAQLRDSYNFSYNAEIEFAVGAAIKSLGPQIVLDAIPLQTSEYQINLKRSWILPILKDCISHSSLAYFIDNLLPLANYCEKKNKVLKENNDGIGAHSHELLNSQIWALLPSFCNNAQDIQKNFKNIARTLGTIISEKKHLRLSAMASLRRLIQISIDNNNQDDIEELARFAKNYIPILFNLYTVVPIGSDEEGHRLSCYETIKVYLKITNEQLIGEFFDKALKHLSEPSKTEFFKESIFDLLRVLCQFIDVKRIQILYKKCIPLLSNAKYQKEQKKAYRLLEEIFSNESKVCQDFVIENRKLLQKLIMKSSLKVEKLSKAVRIRCIIYLVERHPQLEKTKFLKTIIPEAIMGIKELNEKCRSSSYILLNTIAKKLLHTQYFEEYINTLITGLDNNPIYCSASLLALSSILYHYSGSLGSQAIQNILEVFYSNVTQPLREIVLSALSLIKVYVSVMPTPTVAPNLQKIIHSLTSMNDDCKRHFRQKVRDIMLKLIRKFGDIINKMVPASDQIMHKRLKNMRKKEVRKKKLKEINQHKKDDEFNIKRKSKSFEEILADSDDEFYSYNQELIQTHEQKINKKFLFQENEEKIVDFINPTDTKIISASKFNCMKHTIQSKEKNHGFKTALDGRLIISDSIIDDINEIKIKNKLSFIPTKLNNDNMIKDMKSMESNKQPSLLQRKRRLSASVEESMVSNTHHIESNNKSSGFGIHHSIKKMKNEKEPGEEYKAKRAFGDIKIKGKPDPYVYVPLNRCGLNPRKKTKNSNTFKKLLSRSKKDKHTQKNSRNKKKY